MKCGFFSFFFNGHFILRHLWFDEPDFHYALNGLTLKALRRIMRLFFLTFPPPQELATLSLKIFLCTHLKCYTMNFLLRQHPHLSRRDSHTIKNAGVALFIFSSPNNMKWAVGLCPPLRLMCCIKYAISIIVHNDATATTTTTTAPPRCCHWASHDGGGGGGQCEHATGGRWLFTITTAFRRSRLTVERAH